MLFMIETPMLLEIVHETSMVETIQVPWLETTEDFYLRPSAKELEEELETYRLEQEELARLQREKEEAEKQERLRQEELVRQRKLEERKRQEELERQRQALLVPTFDPYDITKTSNLNSEQFYQILGNTNMLDVAWVFSYAEQHYGINALFLAGLTILESGWGTSARSIQHNNMTGYGINTDNHIVKFENRSDSILATAKLLATHYIPRDGKYHNGVSVWNINQKYCASSDWADKIISIANRLLNSL